MSTLSLAVRWAVDTVLYQEGPAVHVTGVYFHFIGVPYWIECVIPDSETDHCLLDPVSEAWHIGLAEFEGTVSGEVHREGENEDPTVDPYAFFVALLWRLLTPYRFPVLCVKGNVPNLVFPC